MVAVNYSQFREQLKSHMDNVTENYETVIVTRKENKNVVMISEKTYNNMLENMHLMGTKANYDWLMESKAQLQAGKARPHHSIPVHFNFPLSYILVFWEKSLLLHFIRPEPSFSFLTVLLSRPY